MSPVNMLSLNELPLQITENFTAKVCDFGLSRLSNVKNSLGDASLQLYIGKSNRGPLRYENQLQTND